MQPIQLPSAFLLDPVFRFVWIYVVRREISKRRELSKSSLRTPKRDRAPMIQSNGFRHHHLPARFCNPTSEVPIFGLRASDRFTIPEFNSIGVIEPHLISPR